MRKASASTKMRRGDYTKKARRAPPIVGVGASAGGLDAFERLLRHLPPNTGMAFVLIQHLDPMHESRLSEILAQSTKMTVLEAREGLRVEPNKVYVIPPNRSMRIVRRTLHLEPRGKSHARYAPVDLFLESLAAEHGDKAIGVILSGTASDGTAGMKAIKAAGGITFAQDANSARYFGMPGSAIAAEAVDFILSPEEIAAHLARLRDHPYARLPGIAQEQSPENEPETPIVRLFALLKSSLGVDFSAYKFSTIDRRISRRMALRGIDRLEHYVRRVQEDPEELRALFQDMFIGVTEFFRDPGMFKALEKTVYPAIARAHSADSPIRVWVPGCSTGEEVYSLAISLLEYLGRRAKPGSIQIFGTDVNDEAIKKARQGRYGIHIESSVPPARLRRFFTASDDGYQIIKTVRDLCVFAKHDILKDPPFKALDLLSCRNLLIYLNSESQRKLLPMFHYALKPNGILVLGPEEAVGGFGDLFSPRDPKYKFYARTPGPKVAYFEPSLDRQPLAATTQPSPALPAARNDLERHKDAADQLILNHYGPPAVLLNQNLEILHLRGHTGPYLELSPGIASLNALKMAREGLLEGLRASLETALKKNTPVTKRGLRIESGGREKTVDIRVVPVKMPGAAERTFLVLFEDGTRPRALPSLKLRFAHSNRANIRNARLKQELATTKAYLQSVIEGQEASNEELRSVNEELMSANEELQSTTEELETTNEELQTVNEELTTLNDELRSRTQELDRANNDILNVIGSMNTSILIVDRDLCIRRLTPPAEKALHLSSADIGRNLCDVRLPIPMPDLQRHLQQTMETLKPFFYSDVRDEKGRLYMLQIRPYITADKAVEGAMIGLTDISQGEERFQVLADVLPEAVAFIDADRRYVFTNAACEKWHGILPGQGKGLSIQKVYGEEVYGILQPTIEKALAGEPAEFEGYVPYLKAGRRYVHIEYLPRMEASNRVLGVYSVLRDNTALKEADERFRIFVENAPVAIVIHDPNGKMAIVNSELEHMFGYSRGEMLGQPVELLIPPRLHDRHVQERIAYMKQPYVRPMGIGLDLKGRRKDGSEFPIEISLSPIVTSSITFVSATIFDLTDRKRLEEQSRLATILEERARLARDLHDTIAQGFTGIIMNVEAAQEAVSDLPPEARLRLKKAEEVARENLEEVRRSLVELSKPSRRKIEDLAASLRDMADRENSKGKTRVKFSLRGALRPLSLVVAENLFFIAQQAADNAQRHAHARVIDIRLHFHDHEVRLRVQDDGTGFDVGGVKQGLGLAGMRDRAKYIGGRFALKSQPKKGTAIEVRVPLLQQTITGG